MKKVSFFIILSLTLLITPIKILATSSSVIQSSQTNTSSAVTSQNVDSVQSLLTIINPVAKPSFAPNNNSAVYCTIKNDSDRDFILVNASAISIANNTALHKSYVDEKGIARMVPLKQIVIPAHSEIVLAPGGIHVMLTDLKRNLKAGDSFKLNFYFESISVKSVNVTVQNLN